MNSVTKSDRIRQIAKQGLSVRQIADEVGIRYQHAYNVLKASGLSAVTAKHPSGIAKSRAIKSFKPKLVTSLLLAGGFLSVSRWSLTSEGALTLTTPVDKAVGVYAFAIDGIVQYVGVATMGLSKRLNSYRRPVESQKTNLRLNAIMREKLHAGCDIEVLVAMPSDFEWNGLPVHGTAGLELGLIKKFDLPWNMRSSN